MAFGRKKDKRAKPAEKGGGLLKKLGVEAERVPTNNELENKATHDKILLVWSYVRDQIDRGVKDYFRSDGEDTEKLTQYVGRPAIDTMLAELDRLRQAGVVWAQPDRSTRTRPRVDVVSMKLSSGGQPEMFVVRERFEDHSIYRAANGEEKLADGTERVIEAKVQVKGGKDFLLLSVSEIKGVTI